ncbi:Ras-GAP domain-containing protein [Entamoeba marina]
MSLKRSNNTKNQIYGDKHKFDDLMFQPDSELLHTYCLELIKRKPTPDCTNNARLLLEYFNVHGRLLSLMKTTARKEIETTNNETQIFRGNTSFTRLYGEYTRMCLSHFLRNATKKTIHKLMDDSNALSPDIINNPDNPQHSQALQLFSDVMSGFCNDLISSLSLLPAHFYQLLRFVCALISKKQNQKSTPQNTFNLLFFLRFVIPTFHSPQLVTDTAQVSPQCLQRLTFFSKTCQSLLNGTATTPTLPNEVTLTVSSTTIKLFELTTAPGSSYMLEKSGLDFEMQQIAYQRMLQLVRDNQEVLANGLQTDPEAFIEIINCVSREERDCAVMDRSLQLCSDAFSERIAAVESENAELTEEIEISNKEKSKLDSLIKDEESLGQFLRDEIARLQQGKTSSIVLHRLLSDKPN